MTTHPAYLTTYAIEEMELEAEPVFFRMADKPVPTICELLGEDTDELTIEYLMEGVEDAGNIDR